MTRTFLPLLLALTATALAGGVEPINRSQPLHWVPGVLTVTSGRIGAQPYTDAITLRVNGQLVQVFVSTGVRSDNANTTDQVNTGINSVMAWVPSPTATAAQKQALVHVARAYLRGCYLNVTPAQLNLLGSLARWEDGGWHEKSVQGVTIGWADGNGFGFGNSTELTKPRAGLSVDWPSQGSRCQF